MGGSFSLTGGPRPRPPLLPPRRAIKRADDDDGDDDSGDDDSGDAVVAGDVDVRGVTTKAEADATSRA